MFYGKLTKLSDNNNSLRTNEIDGEFLDLPESGFSFIIIGESLTKDMPSRRVTTSKIIYIHYKNNVFHFQTINSKYKLEVYEQKHNIQ